MWCSLASWCTPEKQISFAKPHTNFLILLVSHCLYRSGRLYSQWHNVLTVFEKFCSRKFVSNKNGSHFEFLCHTIWTMLQVLNTSSCTNRPWMAIDIPCEICETTFITIRDLDLTGQSYNVQKPCSQAYLLKYFNVRNIFSITNNTFVWMHLWMIN